MSGQDDGYDEASHEKDEKKSRSSENISNIFENNLTFTLQQSSEENKMINHDKIQVKP